MADINLKLQQMAREDEERHTKEQAQKLGLPYINLVGYPFAPDVMALVPANIANQYRIVAYLRAGDLIRLATHEPQNPELKNIIAQLQAANKARIEISYCSETSIRYALDSYRLLLPETKEAKVEVTEEKEAGFEQEIATLEGLKEKISQVSTSELLDVLFAGAIKLDASDIHLEPGEQNFRIRYRIDGVLEEIAQLPMSAFHNLLSRIKFLAKLKLDVTHPQDGRFEIKVLATDVDIRVATLPTSYGEAVGMRLLPKNKKFLKLDNLGFPEDVLKMIREAMAKPQGMIINTGPTGSGKTTTLYAILQELNQPGKKIITLEDPIEYRVAGIEQIQIDAENKTGFLDALKGSLRQDPDILMIGEIRDQETARIALQAAMTGHLVLTTLHTNNAPAALARLTDIGVEPYLLAGSINLIIGQRLVRTIHQECGGKGCPACRNTGFKGRIAIVEAIAPGPEIEKLIRQKAALRDFEETAHKLGMRTMYEDGMDKVAKGLTTKEEVERVTKE
jgi:type IV pilus assembly protein PilB